MGKIVKFEPSYGKVQYNKEAFDERQRKYKMAREESKRKIKVIGLSALIALMATLAAHGIGTSIYNSYLNKEVPIPPGYAVWTVERANYNELKKEIDKEEKSTFRKKLDNLKNEAKEKHYDAYTGGPVDIPNLIPTDSPEYIKYQEILAEVDEIVNSGATQQRTSYGKDSRTIAEDLVPSPTEIYANFDEYMDKRFKLRLRHVCNEAQYEILRGNNGSEPVYGVSFYTLPDEYFIKLGQKALLEAVLDTVSLNDEYRPESYDFDTILDYCNSQDEVKGIRP